MTGESRPTRITVRKPGRLRKSPRAGELELTVSRLGSFSPTHPTTRLCLELLADAAQSGLVKGRWLDVGSGTGVLAVALGRLGAESVVACDIDHLSTLATLSNMRANELDGRVLAYTGSIEALRGPFEGIIANLPAAVLSAMWRSFGPLLSPRGALLLSGLREPEGQWLAASLAKEGFLLREMKTRHETAIELPPSGSFTWAGLSLELGP